MKIKCIVLFLLIAQVAVGQNLRRTLADEIMIECDAVIIVDEKVQEGTMQIVATEVSSYYSEELVKMKVSKVRDRYNDVKVVKPWARDNDGDIIVYLSVNDKVLCVNYSEKNQRLYFLYVIE